MTDNQYSWESRLYTMTDEEKAHLDLLANCIIEDSERTTLPGEDIQALHSEIARLRAKCEAYRRALTSVDASLARLQVSIKHNLDL